MFSAQSQTRFLILFLSCVVTGCAKSAVTKRAIVWNFSSARSTAALEGGSWVGGQPTASEQTDLYHVKGDSALTITVILPDARFDFDSVAHAYVTRRGNNVRTIDVASFGYSEEEVINRLMDMHKKWNGMGIGNIEKWRSNIINNRDLSGYSTVIHKSSGPSEPSITATIRYNFGGNNTAWFIMVTFFWDTP